MPDVRIGYRPFPEQQAYFRRKVNMPSARWDDLMHGEHAHGFMVAGVARADVLDELRTAVQSAIDDGEGFEAFRARADDIIRKHGWIGGAGDESEARRAWRMRTIYQTNLRTSYMAGRWEQLQAFPFLRYQHNNTVANPREQHQVWNGLVLATDDPWWDTHYPPNGWGCRCTITGVGKGRMRVLGKDGPDPAPDPSDGDPPPEWAYHPGKAARSMGAAESFGRKVMELPPEWRKIALDDAQGRRADWFPDWSTFVRSVADTGRTTGAASPVGFLPDGILDALARPVERKHVVAGMNPQSALVAMADRQVGHALRHNTAADRASIVDALADLPAWLADPATRVWRQVSPDRVVFGRPLNDGRMLAVYVRLGAQPVRPGRGMRVESNWVATAEIRAPEEMADYVPLR